MQLDLGGVTINWLGWEQFCLDAGTMFGPVPRLLWQGRYPKRNDNMSPFVATPLLVRTSDENILIDTGLGNRLTERYKRNMQTNYIQTVPDALLNLGVDPQHIHAVILTHLDWDHAAGIVEEAGKVERLRYPQATHYIHRIEWNDANNPNMRTKNTYWRHNWDVLEKEGTIQLLHGDETIGSAVRVHHTGGHTRGHIIVEIVGKNDKAFHFADLLPTHAHTNPLWITAYDNYPLDSIEQKQYWLAEAVRNNAWLTMYHDVTVCAFRLKEDGNIAERLIRSNSIVSDERKEQLYP